MGVGLGQTLNCPHSAHRGTRELPRGFTGPPGEVEVGYDSLWG